MNYWIITDKIEYANKIESQIAKCTQGTNNKNEFEIFITTNYEFEFLQVISDINKRIIDISQVIIFIDLEFLYSSQNNRSYYNGLDLALALRSMNKFRISGPIILFGFSALDEIVYGNEPLDLKEYGLVYRQLPFTENTITDVFIDLKESGDITTDDQNITINEDIVVNRYTRLPEYYVLGLIDDQFEHVEKQLDLGIESNDKLNGFYKVLSFPYDNNKNFQKNFTEIKKWIVCNDVLDLLLLDINFENPNKEGIYRGGIDVLNYLSEQDYQVPISMLSVSKDVETVKNITLNFRNLITDYIKVESKLNYHSKIDILNKTEVVEQIKKILHKVGAVRNRFGILISHGTDTMAWTLSLLKYSIKGLKCNIVLTGSQIPLKSEFSPSDAPANLIFAMHVLNQFVPPQIGVSFDRGMKFFTDNLQKVRIWNEDAFDGNISASYNWQQIESDYSTLQFMNCMDEIQLVTTGGTIAMNNENGQTGKPSKQPMERFFKSDAAKYRIPSQKKYPLFNKFKDPIIEVSEIDSSEMNPSIYKKLLSELEELNNKDENFASEIDDKFRWDVYPVLCSPFMKNDDYKIYEEYAKKEAPLVFILMGYGASNLPYRPEEGYSPMDFARKMIENGNIVILTSQVQQEIPDIDYEVSVQYVKEGTLFAGHMSLAEIMIKSAYVLGHVSNKEDIMFLKSAIMSGVQFRSKNSRKRYLNLINSLPKNKQYVVTDNNYFKTMSFESAKEKIQGHIKHLIEGK